MSEWRVIRDRLGESARALDRAAGGRPSRAAARQLVQVYDGGSMGAAANLVYLTHPVQLDGAETEGGSATPTADASKTLPVVVLWNAPSAGDILTAYAVGGRWVAEGGGSTPGCSNCGLCNSPGGCIVPPGDMVLTGNAGSDFGPITLTYQTSPACTGWSVGNCFVDGCQNIFGNCIIQGTFKLLDTGPDFVIQLSSGDTCDEPIFQYQSAPPAGECLSLGAACLQLTLQNGPCPSGGEGFIFQGTNSFGTEITFTFTSVDNPNTYVPPAQPLMCSTFTVYGCNGIVYPGLTVTISQGGTEVATGITGSNGLVFLVWTGTPGVYDISVTGQSDRFAAYSGSVSLPCATNVVIDLTPADGYHCIGTCLQPLGSTVDFTDSIVGSLTVTYYSSYTLPGGAGTVTGWVGTITYSYPGCTADDGDPPFCQAYSSPLTYVFTGASTKVYGYYLASNRCLYELGLGYSYGEVAISYNDTISCPAEYDYSAQGWGGAGGDLSWIYCGSTASYSATEA
jgi:hypothetical protein